MNRNLHRICDYLTYTGDVLSGLTPTADNLKEIANTEWWTVVSEHFGAILYQNFFNRTVLMDPVKYPYDITDPDNTDNMDTCVTDIILAFTINLRVNARKYEKMYKVFMADYEPLYNVDAYEFEDRTLDQTGSETNAKSGDDTSKKTGNIENEKLGKESSTRTGSETMSHAGADVTINQKTTYDSSSFYDTDKSTITPGVTDTNTYNNVKDETQFTGRKDRETFNNVTDKMEYNSQDQNVRDLHDAEHIKRRRYGNIGVTKSSELLVDSMREAELTGNFIYQVVHDCVNTCTYMVE